MMNELHHNLASKLVFSSTFNPLVPVFIFLCDCLLWLVLTYQEKSPFRLVEFSPFSLVIFVLQFIFNLLHILQIHESICYPISLNKIYKNISFDATRAINSSIVYAFIVKILICGFKIWAWIQKKSEYKALSGRQTVKKSHDPEGE